MTLMAYPQPCRPSSAFPTRNATVPVFKSTQLELQEAVRRMVETEVAPIAQSIDESEVFPMHLVEIFGVMG